MKQNNIDRQARDKKAAVIGVAFFAGLMLICAVSVACLCFIPDAPGWLVALFAILAVGCLVPIIPAFVVMKQRFKEIERGELDEAAQY